MSSCTWREHGAYLLGVEIVDTEFGAVAQERDLLAVGREFWLERVGLLKDQRLLLYFVGIGKLLVVRTHEACAVYAPAAIALSRVDERASVGGEVYVALLLGVSVMRLVVLYSIEVTYTSPWLMKAISLPFSLRAMERAPLRSTVAVES